MFLVLYLGATSSWQAITGVQFTRMDTAAHCEAVLAAIKPLQRAFATVCITAEGEVLGWE